MPSRAEDGVPEQSDDRDFEDQYLLVFANTFDLGLAAAVRNKGVKVGAPRKKQGLMRVSIVSLALVSKSFIAFRALFHSLAFLMLKM